MAADCWPGGMMPLGMRKGGEGVITFSIDCWPGGMMSLGMVPAIACAVSAWRVT